MYFVRSGHINLTTASLWYAGLIGYAWSSTAEPSSITIAELLDLNQSNTWIADLTPRHFGLSLHLITLSCISSVVALSSFRPVHSDTQATVVSSGTQPLIQPTFSTPSSLRFILASSTCLKPMVATMASPFALMPPLCISSVVAISSFPAAHSMAQAIPASSGHPPLSPPLLNTLFIFILPSLTPIHQPIMIAIMLFPSITYPLYEQRMNIVHTLFIQNSPKSPKTLKISPKTSNLTQKC